jgi:hypothetical protein
MLPLRCLEGRTPRSTHCRMRRSPKKQNQLSHTLFHSRSYPFHVPHLLPQHTNVLPHREPSMSAEPAALFPTLARSMEVVRRCCRGVCGSPPPWCGALTTPGGALSHPGDRAPPPSPPSQGRYRCVDVCFLALLAPIPYCRR